MKKIIIAMAAIAAAFTMASCNKEQPVSPNENPTVGKSVITASIENDATKTTLEGNDDEGYKVVWSEGDAIYVVDLLSNSWGAKYTLDKSSAGNSYGTFSWHDGDYFYSEDKINYPMPIFDADNTYIALYPFDITKFDDQGKNIGGSWKTEQTYTEMCIPMYARTECEKDGDAEFEFTNIGGLLRLTVKGTAKIRSIELRAAETMSGTIDCIAYEDDGYIAFMKDGAQGSINYITLDCGEEGVALKGEEGTDFYFSLPCCYDSINWKIGGYTGVTITLTDTEGRTCVKKLNNKNLVIERSKITTASFTASEWILPGKFSVAEGKQVQFSSGNLTCDISGEKPKWRFYEHQNDFATEYDSNLISLFTWGYDATNSVNPAGTEYIGGHPTDGEPFSKNEDWGYVFGGDSSVWRTLTIAEWEYLFSNHACKWVVVDGVDGYAIAPDGFEGTIADSYSDDTELVASNFVFLPAAGYRVGSMFHVAGEDGYYWSSSACIDDTAFSVYLTDDCYPFYPDDRSHGCSVRLVTDCD